MQDTALEKWRWRLNREIAEYLTQPTSDRARAIEALLANYRQHYAISSQPPALLSELFLTGQ